MFTMLEVAEDCLECIQNHDMPVAEAVDATVSMYDLSAGERRELIQSMAKKGYRYDS